MAASPVSCLHFREQVALLSCMPAHSGHHHSLLFLPHFSFTWLARRRQRSEHTPPVCVQSGSQKPWGTPGHARPQLKRHLKAAAPGSPAHCKKLRLAHRNIPLETLGSSLPGQSSLRLSAKCRQERTVAPARRIMERIPSAQPPPTCLPKTPGLEHGDLSG